MRVILSEAEQRLAQYLAKKRHKANRDAMVTDAKIGKQSAELTDLNGVGGELAFCKAVNVYPDLTTGDGHPDHDCILNGSKWDVKTTVYSTGQLVVRKMKQHKQCDFYVLVVGTFPEYTIAGWAAAGDVFRSENITDLGYGETYAVGQQTLYPPEVLIRN